MFSLNDLKERLHEEEYVYFVKEDTKEVFEHNLDSGLNLMADAKVFKEFPYEHYGYEDPYTFTNEWTVYTVRGVVKYEVDKNGKVQEVYHGVA